MDTLSNGDLLTVAEEAGFDLLLTTDKNIRYQQNLEGRRIARNPSVRPGHSAGEPIATGSRMLAHSHLIGASMGWRTHSCAMSLSFFISEHFKGLMFDCHEQHAVPMLRQSRRPAFT
jgi:hypothetical protein